MKAWPLNLGFPRNFTTEDISNTPTLFLTLAQTEQFCVPGCLLELQTVAGLITVQCSCCLKYLSIPRQRERQGASGWGTSNLTTNVFNQSTSSLPPTSTTDQSQFLASWALRLSHPNPDWIHFLLQSLIKSPGGHNYDRQAPLLPAEAGPGAQDPVEGALGRASSEKGMETVDLERKITSPPRTDMRQGYKGRSCCLYSAF